MAADRDRLIGFAGAVLVHLLVVGLLVFSMEKRPEAPASPAVKPLVQATVVSEEAVMEPRRRREAEEEARQRRIEEDKRQAAEEQRRAEEQKRKAAESEKKRQAELKQKQEAEKARLAELERQRKIEAEKKRKEEAERKAAEARKKAEAEQKRLAELKKKQEAEERLKQAMAAEADRIAQEQQRLHQQQLLSVRQQYMADIRNKVERNWLRPTGSRGSHCRVVIHQIPGGEVVDVRLTECDGDVAFQRSVEAAVRKASPLPPPSNPEVFDREIEFVFEP